MKQNHSGDLASRLSAHAKNSTPPTGTTLLDQIISARSAIFALLEEGHSARQINEWLAQEGIHISNGAFRNYIANIRKAKRVVVHRNLSTVSDSAFREIYNEIRDGCEAKHGPDRQIPQPTVAQPRADAVTRSKISTSSNPQRPL